MFYNYLGLGVCWRDVFHLCEFQVSWNVEQLNSLLLKKPTLSSWDTNRSRNYQDIVKRVLITEATYAQWKWNVLKLTFPVLSSGPSLFKKEIQLYILILVFIYLLYKDKSEWEGGYSGGERDTPEALLHHLQAFSKSGDWSLEPVSLGMVTCTQLGASLPIPKTIHFKC